MKLRGIPTVVLVASGKGGVGKTQMSADLARLYDHNGYRVGLIDADISTPNAPQAVGGEGFDWGDQRISDGDSFRPIEADGIQVFSQGIALPDDVVMLRDGQFRAETIIDYVRTVEWDDMTDVVVVDSPPGSGEEVQTIISETMPDIGYIVTTGSNHSLRDARRTHELFEEADLDHRVIANMIRAIPDLDYDYIAEEFQDVDQIGEGRADKLVGIVEKELEEYGITLHDDGIDVEERVGAPVVADVPHTGDRDRRLAALEPLLDSTPLPQEVEA